MVSLTADACLPSLPVSYYFLSTHYHDSQLFFFVNYLHSLLQQTNLGTDTCIWKCRSHHYCKWRHFGRDCCHMDRFELQKVKNNNWSSLASYIHGLNYRLSSFKSNPNSNPSLSMPETPIWNYLPVRAQVPKLDIWAALYILTFALLRDSSDLHIYKICMGKITIVSVTCENVAI